jgi:ATP-dependent RNA helicase DeaD
MGDLCALIPLLLDTFDTLGLSAPLLKSITEMGFETPTDIQAQAIPLLLEGDRDFIGLAQTGTGKTAAFGLPLLDLLDTEWDHVQALVLAPTRELGQQIAEQLDKYAKYSKGLKTVAVYGGANIATQIAQLKKPCHVVIATPGRLIDLAKRKAVKLDRIRHLVLDEADEMLNMGFKEELDEILSFTPEDKCTWLFSATMPREIRRMVGQYMTDPLEVHVNRTEAVNQNIEHQYALVRHSDKSEAIARFLDLDPELYGVVFCRTRRDTQALAEELLKRGYRADALHGEMSQAQRDRVMLRFKQKHLQVLVATDVAARGIDVDDLTHVFHHSLPGEAAQYAHRSGRTARAGKTGISLAMMSIKERSHLNRLANTLDINFTQTLVPNPEEIVHARLSTWGQGLIELPVGQGIPDEIWEQMTVLFEGHSKEDLLRQIVLSEMRKLDTAGKADLNQKDMAGRRRDRDDRDGRGRRGYGNDGDSWDSRAPRSHRDKPFAKKRKPTGKSGGKPYSKSAGEGAGKPAWDDVKPGKPMGAGKAKKKASKKPAFKPGQEPWAGKSTGSPGFSVKPKGRGKRR